MPATFTVSLKYSTVCGIRLKTAGCIGSLCSNITTAVAMPAEVQLSFDIGVEA